MSPLTTRSYNPLFSNRYFQQFLEGPLVVGITITYLYPV